MTRFRWVAAGAAAALALSACSAPTTTESEPALDDRGCVTGFSADTDYYPVKSEIKHAENFTLTYHDTYQVLEVKEPAEGLPAEKYVLHRCGTPAPELTGDLAGAQVVETPVMSLFSGSSTHLAMLEELDDTLVVNGVSSGAFVSNEDIRQRLADGHITEYAPNGQIDTEVVIAGQPDVVVTGGMDDPGYATIIQAGIPVVANAEWLETSPLGRAEWVKMLAALTGGEDAATQAFEQIEQDYTATTAKAADVDAVTVLPGQMSQGTWYVPGGDSYVAQFIADAGGTYAWSQTTGTGSQSLSLEDVLAQGRDAQVWLLSSATVTTKADLLAEDPRYAEFAAYAGNNVWNNNAQVNESGGNDYWERGVARPDIVLADLAKILHPDLVSDHELDFYQPVE